MASAQRHTELQAQSIRQQEINSEVATVDAAPAVRAAHAHLAHTRRVQFITPKVEVTRKERAREEEEKAVKCLGDGEEQAAYLLNGALVPLVDDLDHMHIDREGTRTIPTMRQGLNVGTGDGAYLTTLDGCLVLKADLQHPFASSDKTPAPDHDSLDRPFIQHPKAARAYDKPILQDEDRNMEPEEQIMDAHKGRTICVVSTWKGNMVTATYSSTIQGLMAAVAKEKPKQVELQPREPQTIQEARSSARWPQWKKAMEEEIRTINERNTWELTDLPPNRRALGVKWVLVVKTTAEGGLERFKARLVAKGYRQIPGTDFHATYGPVGRFTSLRMLMAVAAANEQKVQHEGGAQD